MSQVLEHQPRDRQPGLLREAWRVLRPGGILWIDTPNQLSFKDRHDTGLPFIHWLPRRLKVPLARALGRSVPTREPAFGYIDVGLHWYISSFRLRKLLVELGPHEVLSRYRGYAGADHYEEARQEEGRSGVLFRAKVAVLRASLFVYDWNVFHDLRLVIRKGVPAREGRNGG
jgi:SAM-dependent methyltransferase